MVVQFKWIASTYEGDPRTQVALYTDGRSCGQSPSCLSKFSICSEQGSHFIYPMKFPDFSLTFPWFPKIFP